LSDSPKPLAYRSGNCSGTCEMKTNTSIYLRDSVDGVQQNGSSLLLTNGYVRRRRMAWRASSRSLHRFRRFLLRYTQAIWSEIRTLIPRILLLQSRILSKEGLPFGPVWTTCAKGHLVQNTGTNERIHHIEFVKEKFPWVSEVEVYFLLLGWNMAEQSANQDRDIPCSCNTHSCAIHSACSCSQNKLR
jgi:hypothetical protein